MAVFHGKKTHFRWPVVAAEARANRGFQRFRKYLRKGVDGQPSVAIMPRSLRTRCASADPQVVQRRRRRAVIYLSFACILVGCVQIGDSDLNCFTPASWHEAIKVTVPGFVPRSLTIQSDNLCGCLRWSLRRQNQRKNLSFSFSN